MFSYVLCFSLHPLDQNTQEIRKVIEIFCSSIPAMEIQFSSQLQSIRQLFEMAHLGRILEHHSVTLTEPFIIPKQKPFFKVVSSKSRSIYTVGDFFLLDKPIIYTFTQTCISLKSFKDLTLYNDFLKEKVAFPTVLLMFLIFCTVTVHHTYRSLRARLSHISLNQ